MKKINSKALLQQLENDTRQIMLQVNYLLRQDPEVLLQQPAAGQWSVAQVIEHLNTYGRYYLPLLQQGIDGSQKPATTYFTPGLLGNYFTKTMLPKEGQVKNKMAAFKNHQPSPDVDSKKVLEEFLQQEQWLLQLLNKSATADIGKIKIPISIARFIKLKAGDTFRFVVAHHQRHFVQVKKTLEAVKGKKETLNAGMLG